MKVKILVGPHAGEIANVIKAEGTAEDRRYTVELPGGKVVTFQREEVLVTEKFRPNPHPSHS
jgi:uncharacterized protein YcbX